MDVTSLLDPVTPGAPAGPSLRDEPVWHRIQHMREIDPAVPWNDGARRAAYTQVVTLAAEALRRSKDLFLAAWLAEAWTYREGMPGLAAGLELLASLLDRFWAGLHPALDDGDPGMRAAPLERLDRFVPVAVAMVPLTRGGHGARAWHESRKFAGPPRENAEPEETREWQRAVAAGLVSAQEFDAGLAATPATWLSGRRDEAGVVRTALAALEDVCEARFGSEAPRFTGLRKALDDYEIVAAKLVELRRAATADPADPAEDAPPSGDAGAGRVASVDAHRDGAAPERNRAGVSGDGDRVDQPDRRGDSHPPRGTDAMDGRGTGTDRSEDGEGGGAPDRPADPPSVPPTTDSPRSREDAGTRMAALARWLRAQDPADPAPYLMTRGFRWGELRAGDLDPRLLAAPPTDGRVRLRRLALDGRWAELLDAAEEMMAAEHGRGWLDLQRYAVTACEALGAEYDAVGRAIAGALRGLLADLPALPGLALMDDSPAANAETAAWLRAAGIVGDAAAHEAPVPATVEARARALAAAGDAQGAVRVLMDAADAERSPRARFLLRTEAAEVLVDARREAVAAPLLRDLAAQADRHALDGWESPDVVARPLALLCRCLDALGDAEGDREALYRRVCRLDPLRALPLRGGARAAA